MMLLSTSASDKVVHWAWKQSLCCLALVVSILVPLGCVHHDQDLSEKDFPTGYYEIKREGTVYVLGSIQSADQLNAGKPPANMVESHTRRGEPLVFEDNGLGLSSRLMAEYDRRHGAQ